MINRVINKISHSIYKDIEEFKRYNPNTDAKYNWRDGTEGNWVVSDDGQVCQVLKRGKLKASRSDKVIKNYIRVPLGTFVCTDKTKMEGDPRKNLYSFGLANTNAYKHKIEKKETTQREFLFAQFVAKGTDLVDAFLKQMKSVVDNQSSNDRDKIQAIKTLMQITGMMDTEKRTESVAVFQGFTKEQLDAIGSGKVKQIASAEREVDIK